MIDSLPYMKRMNVYLVADCIRKLVAAEGEKGILAISLIGAEFQLQDAEQEWDEHERMRLAEQDDYV